MVFSVNAPQSGPTTFEAFETRAKQLNGTMGGSGVASSANPKASAMYPRAGHTSFLAMLAGVILVLQLQAAVS